MSGSYGIGYCYYFWARQSRSFGEAALGCVSIEKETHLLDIENEAENAFLVDTIVRQMRGMHIVSPAMFSTQYLRVKNKAERLFTNQL